jgi:predicted dehydrogenase
MTYQTEITGGTDFQSLNRRKLENFVHSIEGTASPAVPGEYGLRVTALTEAAYRSADQGVTVDLESFIEDAREERSRTGPSDES